MRGDPEILTKEFAVDFSLERAMGVAGYKGVGRVYEAVRDIEKHAHTLRLLVKAGATDSDEQNLQRIVSEYERIAFSRDDDSIRIADKLKALDMYRLLTTKDDVQGSSHLTVRYDYGDEG